jgi:hypothetical protein
MVDGVQQKPIIVTTAIIDTTTAVLDLPFLLNLFVCMRVLVYAIS